jgi:hypothetical protein
MRRWSAFCKVVDSDPSERPKPVEDSPPQKGPPGLVVPVTSRP